MFEYEGPKKKGVWSCELKRKPSISGRIFDYTRQLSPLCCPITLIVFTNNIRILIFFLPCISRNFFIVILLCLRINLRRSVSRNFL